MQYSTVLHAVQYCSEKATSLVLKIDVFCIFTVLPYNKRIIARMMVNIVPSRILYCTSLRVYSIERCACNTKSKNFHLYLNLSSISNKAIIIRKNLFCQIIMFESQNEMKSLFLKMMPNIGNNDTKIGDKNTNIVQ